MAVLKEGNMEGLLLVAIEQRVKEAIGEEFENQKEEMIKRIDQKKAETIAGCAIQIMKMIDMNRMGDNLTITVRQLP